MSDSINKNQLNQEPDRIKEEEEKKKKLLTEVKQPETLFLQEKVMKPKLQIKKNKWMMKFNYE